MSSIHITLKLLGPFRSCADVSAKDGVQQLEIAPEVRLSEALLAARLPADVPRVVLLNGAQRSDDPLLQDGDTVTIFPPIAGG
jgi:molybdopterin converting factor small subunit